MRKRLRIVWPVCAVVVAAVALLARGAAAGALPGCASGTAPGQTVFTVSVSAAGTPFVSTYVASAPTASGNVGCTALPSAAAPFSVNGPGVAVYPLLPVTPIASGVPTTVNMLQVGSYLLMVPATPGLQLYQIAPGFYIVRSLDPSQNVSVVLPLPSVPPAPNTGAIPSVIH